MSKWDYAVMIVAGCLGLVPSLVALLARYELRIRRLKSLLEVYRQFGRPRRLRTAPTSTAQDAPAAPVPSPAPMGNPGDAAVAAADDAAPAEIPADVHPQIPAEVPPQVPAEVSPRVPAAMAREKQDGEGHEYFQLDPSVARFTLNPLVEFVKAKYTADLDSVGDAEAWKDPTKELPLLIKNARKVSKFSNSNLLLGAVVFGISSSVAFYAFLNALLSNFTTIFPSCFVEICNAGNGNSVLVIGTIVFVGGYIAAMRLIIQAVTSFDLTGYTFVRQGAEVLFSVLLGMIIFTAFPYPMQTFGKIMLADDTVQTLAVAEKQKRDAAVADYRQKCPPQSSANDKEKPANQLPPAECQRLLANLDAADNKKIPWYWFVLAVVFGLVPTSSSRYLLNKVQDFFNWTKTTDERFTKITRVTPVDILDGIDFETRYRLEECGLRDVQNLACANPVMLAVESPFNLNELIDWIGQAQLCHLVGLERYMLLREYNVRTIFDLERAIDSGNAPDSFDVVYGSILLSPTEAMKTAAETTRIKFLIGEGQSAKQVSLEEFATWAYGKISQSGGAAAANAGGADAAGAQPGRSPMSEAIEHMMRWISDDLHVRRLRRLWLDIEFALGEDSAFLSDSRRKIKP